VMEQEGLDYAKMVTFADDLETGFTRGIDSALKAIPVVGTLIIPFSKTPMRIMERTIIDYTPLGVFKDRVRKAWVEGGPDVRGEIAARITLSMAAIAAVWHLTGERVIVGNDGGYKNSKRLERPSDSIKIGADVYEFQRFDPMGSLFSIVANIRQGMDARAPDRREFEGDASGAAGDFAGDLTQVAIWSIFGTILGKGMMQSLEGVMRIANAEDADEADREMGQFLASIGARANPASGMQRQFEKWDDSVMRQARGIQEGWLKSSIGADSLPPKRDPLFGRPMSVTDADRLMGIKGGPMISDPITKELARLAFDITPPQWKQRGVDLTSVQMDRLLELRGHTVRGPSGETLEDTVINLIQHPEWDTLVDPQKVELIKKAQRGFTKLAVDQLIREDDGFAVKALEEDYKKAYLLEGKSTKDAKIDAREFAKTQLGIYLEED